MRSLVEIRGWMRANCHPRSTFVIVALRRVRASTAVKEVQRSGGGNGIEDFCLLVRQLIAIVEIVVLKSNASVGPCAAGWIAEMVALTNCVVIDAYVIASGA